MLPWRCLLIILWGVVCCAGYGMMTDGTTTFVNASACTVNFLPMNPPIVIDLPNPRTTWRPSQGKTPSELLPSPRGEEQWGRGRGGGTGHVNTVCISVWCVCVCDGEEAHSVHPLFSAQVSKSKERTRVCPHWLHRPAVVVRDTPPSPTLIPQDSPSWDIRVQLSTVIIWSVPALCKCSLSCKKRFLCTFAQNGPQMGCAKICACYVLSFFL